MTEYYVDQELLEEMARLLKQSVFFIKEWGGLLAERPRLPGMFERAGFMNLTQRHMIVDLSRDSEGYHLACEDYKTLLSLLRPFLVKWGAVATMEEANALYDRTMQEMSQGIVLPDGCIDVFVGFWHFSSIFGQKLI